MTDTTLFREKAPGVMKKLMEEFELSEIQAAGILGNLGHECAGFHVLHEIGKPEGQGGYGWGQWTAARRKAFFAYCKKHNLDWQGHEANLGYLVQELNTTESGAISALHKTATLDAAVVAFERNFERAGVKHYAARKVWAKIALDAYRAS